MISKEKKSVYMKKYHKLVKANGGRKLDSKYGRRAYDLSNAEFNRRFMVKENG